jgi:eukaryotic-like serine/threonine-protein kinase
MEQAAEHDRLIGTQIGNYEVRKKLGEGGMGSVYLAEHPHIGKKVALKVLHAEYANNEDVVARFFNEAKAVNDIQHPNIVDIVDYGVIHDESGKTVYFIMEFLAGEALTGLIGREAPLPPERALTICIQVADALAASHQKGIIHRDLKPDNVMLIQRRRVQDFPKVLDFGIAKLTGDQAGSRRTRTGIVMGTPAYMSPEQCEGKGLIDSRTDVYALGILLYEMLTGRVPFAGEGYGEVLVQHLTQPPVKLTTIRAAIPPHVEAVVLKALEKRPEARYPNMEEFMRAMADPVGYVEAHGGLSAFLQTPITPSDNPAPMPMVSPLTPVPGTLTSLTPAPGHLTATGTPTTLSGGAGEVAGAGGGKKLGIIAAVAVAAVIGGGAFLATRGGDDGQAAATLDEPVQPDPLEVTEPVEPVIPEPMVVTDAAVAETPPAPVKVTVKVESSPAGASVFVGDERKARGQTPLELEFEHLPGDQPRQVELRLEKSRYQDRTETITLTAEETAVAFDWSLKRTRSGSASSGGGKSSGGKSSGGKSSGGKSDGDLGGQIMTPSFGTKKKN